MNRPLIVIICFMLTCIYALGDERDIRIEYYKAHALDTALSSKARADYCDSVIKYSKGEKAYSFKYLQAELLANQQPNKSAEIYKELLTTLPKDSVELRCNILRSITMGSVSPFDLLDMFRYSYELLEIEKPDSLRYFDVYALLKVANIAVQLRNITLAETYLKEAEVRLNDLQSDGNILPHESTILNTILLIGKSSMLEEKGNMEEALDLLNKALELSNNDNSFSIYGQISGLYARIGEYDMAIEYLKKAIYSANSERNKSIDMINYAYLLSEWDRPEEALEYIKENEKEITADSSIFTRFALNKTYYEIYKKLGHPEKACEYLSIAYALNDSLKSSNIDFLAREVTNSFDARHRRAEALRIGKENTVKTLIIIVLSVLFIGVLGGAIILMKRHYNRARETRRLEEKMSLMQSNFEEQSKETIEQLENRNKQLQIMTTFLMNINEFFNDVEKEVVEAKKGESAKDLLKRIDNIHALIKKVALQESAWSMFNDYFDEVNNRLFTKLLSLHPDLTKSELRMSAYILMNITSKEIAALTNRSVRTVEVTKYNLRKKLKIDIPTFQYLSQIMDSKPD